MRSSHRWGVSCGHSPRGQAARQLRPDEMTRALAILALTAHAFDRDREMALAAGVGDLDTERVDFEPPVAKMVGQAPGLPS